MTGASLRLRCGTALALPFLAAGCRGGADVSSHATPAAPAAATAPRPAPPLAWSDILDHARRANAVYYSEATIRTAIGPGPKLTLGDLPGIDVRAFVEVDEEKRRQWVVVRGTANLRNVAEDADYTKVKASDLGVPVHEGFLADEHAVWSFARPLLRPGLDTRVTGHSLGGALAVLLAMRLRMDAVSVGQVVTFGQPKVTTAAGVARFRDLPLLRVVNHDDPVPLLPWETKRALMGGLFRHLGGEVRLTDRGTWQVFAEHAAERYLLTSFVARLGRENPKEHEMARYLARLETLAAASPAAEDPR